MDPRQNCNVTMEFTRERHSLVVDKDQWKFAERGRWARLQRWAWSFLKKTGALSNGTMDRYTYKRVNFRSGPVNGRISKFTG